MHERKPVKANRLIIPLMLCAWCAGAQTLHIPRCGEHKEGVDAMCWEPYISGSTNGRSAGFDPANEGSTPSPETNFESRDFSWGDVFLLQIVCSAPVSPDIPRTCYHTEERVPDTTIPLVTAMVQDETRCRYGTDYYWGTDDVAYECLKDNRWHREWTDWRGLTRPAGTINP